MRFDIRNLLNSNNISTSVSQLIWVLANIGIGKLIAINVAPEVFGRYNLELGLATFAFTLFVTPVSEYYKTKVPLLKNHGDYVPFFIGYALFTALLGTITALTLLYFNQNILELKYVLIVLSYFLFIIGFTYMTHYLNVNGKIVTLAGYNITKSVMHILAIAIGVYLYSKSATMLWAAIIISHLIPFLIMISRRTSRSRLYMPSRGLIMKFSQELFKFSFPLILMSLSYWVTIYADRYILEHFFSKYEVGIYNAGYTLGSKVFLTLSPIFLIIITPKIYNLSKDAHGENTSNKILRRYTVYYALIGILIVVLVFITKNFIGMIFLSETYKDSFDVIPWIALGYMFLTMTVHINTKFYAFSRTRWLLYINIITAVINLTSNFILIPRFGIIGAAFSTAMAFATGFIITFLLIQKKIFK